MSEAQPEVQNSTKIQDNHRVAENTSVVLWSFFQWNLIQVVLYNRVFFPSLV